jgi:hypothetical protein
VALPLPDSSELLKLKLGYQAREIYRLLYETRDSPLTMQEIRQELAHIGTQEQLDRRRRELNPHFVIEKVGGGAHTRYQLIDAKPPPSEIDAGISEKDRAAVLRHGRCAMCGRTPIEDHVKLQVDHKIPREWGGTSDLENLQPLCESCNRGKKNFFSSYDDYAATFRKVLPLPSVHQRLGEFLSAVTEARSDLLELVANPPGTYQEDWQKRLRELRVLGWRIRVRRRREEGRLRVYYRLDHAEPWPDVDIRTEIRRREKLRGY